MIIELFRQKQKCLDRKRKCTSNNIQEDKRPKEAVWPHHRAGADLRVWCIFRRALMQCTAVAPFPGRLCLRICEYKYSGMQSHDLPAQRGVPVVNTLRAHEDFCGV